MKKCKVLSHLAFEDLGVFEPVLRRHGFEITMVDVPTQGVPDSRDDLWVVLGGPLGVYDAPDFPFIQDEIQALASRMLRQAPVLGVCLGAQLMAAALGAKVAVNPQGKELGWSALSLSSEGAAGPLRHLHDLAVLHWHGDAMALPEGATNLAHTALTPCQGFSFGPTALALQFHPEVTALGLERWLVGNLGELSAAKMSIPALRADNARYAPLLADAVQNMLGDWLTQAGLI